LQGWWFACGGGETGLSERKKAARIPGARSGARCCRDRNSKAMSPRWTPGIRLWGCDLWAVPDLSLPCLRMPDVALPDDAGICLLGRSTTTRMARLYPVSPAAVVRFSAPGTGSFDCSGQGDYATCENVNVPVPSGCSVFVAQSVSSHDGWRTSLQAPTWRSARALVLHWKGRPLLSKRCRFGNSGNARGPERLRARKPSLSKPRHLESVGYYRCVPCTSRVLLEDIAGFWVCQQGRYIDRWRITDRRNIEAHRRRLPAASGTLVRAT